MRLRETAFAKINLALHIRARREDGYHDIETLFAFVDKGDVLTARTAEQDAVTTLGAFARELDNPFDNLVAKALSALPRPDGLAVTLEKNLPVAAGLGGGSADAGAIFRMVRDAYGLPDDWRARAARLGADVPACVDSSSSLGKGTGTQIEPVEDDMVGTAVLLVNPGVPMSTVKAYGAWDGTDDGPLIGKSTSEIAGRNGNSFERIATERLGVEPVVETLRLLSETKPFLHRLSGSGATCFALYRKIGERDEAADFIKRRRPEWWQISGALR
ncbi:4-(cytidine 5'-diphospho)-2-C-methyl-D-erythritol kinase [Altererythrobacter aurantiacus]|uniref:4-diphosphocytidyl-2-C-methyl-D-erythritol kinase n=1 Tax=Parapontixanthobacter aurantiacus TaxID=1463599 RepID=A0A844ZEJ4_9SPHN|nr:4-(cytidine 5'-diphospho)-2-C-methyl-D-erythritol kinase [Parapontixanthobacter aurantiacus]MXO85427.1 4-(cytidine 5'-diphospho)-2-C-methyl-D-erythritol kinase [Parapontixanthobacter aurantiacus]